MSHIRNNNLIGHKLVLALVAAAVGKESTGHFLTDTALPNKLLFQMFNELGQHGIGLVNQRDGDLSVGMVDSFYKTDC